VEKRRCETEIEVTALFNALTTIDIDTRKYNITDIIQEKR